MGVGGGPSWRIAVPVAVSTREPEPIEHETWKLVEMRVSEFTT